jgi:RND family efflux transporter MFP subunit
VNSSTRVLKRISIVAVLLLIAGGIAWAVYGKIAAALHPPQPGQRGAAAVAVETAPVQFGPIQHLRTFTGSLRPHSQFEIAPRTSGQLRQLTVDIGDIVRRGQLLALLDDEEHQQLIEQARAELMVAQASLVEKQSTAQAAQRDFTRLQSLRQQQIVSQADLDAAQTRLEAEQAAVRVAEAQVAQRQAALRAAEVRLSYTRIRAEWPEGGSDIRIVGERYADEGSIVAANAPLLLLMDNHLLRAIIHATERDYVQLAIGQPAQLSSAAHPGQLLTGRVTRMTPRFAEGSRQARIEIDVPNPDGLLRPGMFVRVSLQLDQAQQATLVPRQALVRRDGQEGVFLVHPDESQARFVPLTIGIREGAHVQVLEPALQGRVVILGQHLLSDGTAVTFSEASPAAARAPSDPQPNPPPSTAGLGDGEPPAAQAAPPHAASQEVNR